MAGQALMTVKMIANRSRGAAVLKLALLLLSAVVMLPACVTTESGGLSQGSPDEVIAVRVANAKQYLKARDFEGARRHLREALRIDDKSPDVHDALGLTFQASGEYELAEQHFSRAIKYGRGESRYRVNYANFLFQSERFPEAEEQLQEVASDTLYDKREQALVLLGLCQQQMIQLEKAQRSFERALTLNPGNRVVLRHLSLMHFEARDYQRSMQYLQSYRKAASYLDAELLLLGIQLARELDLPDTEASYALALKNLYPESREYQSYLRSKQRR